MADGSLLQNKGEGGGGNAAATRQHFTNLNGQAGAPLAPSAPNHRPTTSLTLANKKTVSFGAFSFFGLISL